MRILAINSSPRGGGQTEAKTARPISNVAVHGFGV